MSKLSVAAAEAWCQCLERLFEKQAGDAGKLAWVVVSAAKYEPGTSKYEGGNHPCPPIVLISPLDTEYLLTRLAELAETLGPEQELALNTDVACCWSDGTFDTYDMHIYDGSPGLSDTKTPKKGWTVLKTKNGHHFYRESEAAFLPTTPLDKDVLLDKAWVGFKRGGCGYIRVTHNIKGSITLLK